jgi:hypothetical protein
MPQKQVIQNCTAFLKKRQKILQVRIKAIYFKTGPNPGDKCITEINFHQLNALDLDLSQSTKNFEKLEREIKQHQSKTAQNQQESQKKPTNDQNKEQSETNSRLQRDEKYTENFAKMKNYLEEPCDLLESLDLDIGYNSYKNKNIHPITANQPFSTNKAEKSTTETAKPKEETRNKMDKSISQNRNKNTLRKEDLNTNDNLAALAVMESVDLTHFSPIRTISKKQAQITQKAQITQNTQIAQTAQENNEIVEQIEEEYDAIQHKLNQDTLNNNQLNDGTSQINVLQKLPPEEINWNLADSISLQQPSVSKNNSDKRSSRDSVQTFSWAKEPNNAQPNTDFTFGKKNNPQNLNLANPLQNNITSASSVTKKRVSQKMQPLKPSTSHVKSSKENVASAKNPPRTVSSTGNSAAKSDFDNAKVDPDKIKFKGFSAAKSSNKEKFKRTDYEAEKIAAAAAKKERLDQIKKKYSKMSISGDKGKPKSVISQQKPPTHNFNPKKNLPTTTCTRDDDLNVNDFIMV